MKNPLLICLLLSAVSTCAQDRFLKAGANFGFSYQFRKTDYSGYSHYPVSPGLKLGYERVWGKRTAFLLDLDANRFVSYTHNDYYKTESKFTDSYLSLIPSIRYYFLKSRGIPEFKNQGIFLQVGFPLIKYGQRTYETSRNNLNPSSTYVSVLSSNQSLEIPFGIGMLYPLNNSRALEFTVSTDLKNLYNQEPWQTIRIGFNYTWLKSKPRSLLDEKKEALLHDTPVNKKETFWKTGVSVNKTLMLGVNHGFDISYPTYPSLNFSYESTNGKRSAFVLNLEVLKKSIRFGGGHYDDEYRISQVSLIPEFRHYFRNKYLRSSCNQGFFLQAGFELIHYSIWESETGSGSGFDLYPAGLNGWFERNVPIGFGAKFHLKNKHGMEVNLNTNLMQIINQGNDQTFSLGVKYSWGK